MLRCSLGLYPPRVLCQKELLVERVEAEDARLGGRALSRRVDANDRIFLSAERADTSLVDGQRSRQNGVANVHATSLRTTRSAERIAALAAARRVAVVGQHGVNQAS